MYKLHLEIPQFVSKLFWDTDVNKATIAVLIERVLTHGGVMCATWLCQNFTKEEIQAVLTSSYNLKPTTVKLWAQVLNLQINQPRCIQKPLRLHVFG